MCFGYQTVCCNDHSIVKDPWAKRDTFASTHERHSLQLKASYSYTKWYHHSARGDDKMCADWELPITLWHTNTNCILHQSLLPRYQRLLELRIVIFGIHVLLSNFLNLISMGLQSWAIDGAVNQSTVSSIHWQFCSSIDSAGDQSIVPSIDSAVDQSTVVLIMQKRCQTSRDSAVEQSAAMSTMWQHCGPIDSAVNHQGSEVFLMDSSEHTRCVTSA